MNENKVSNVFDTFRSMAIVEHEITIVLFAKRAHIYFIFNFLSFSRLKSRRTRFLWECKLPSKLLESLSSKSKGRRRKTSIAYVSDSFCSTATSRCGFLGSNSKQLHVPTAWNDFLAMEISPEASSSTKIERPLITFPLYVSRWCFACFKIIIPRAGQWFDNDLTSTLRRIELQLISSLLDLHQIGLRLSFFKKENSKDPKRESGKQRNAKQRRYDGRIRIGQWELVSLK